ncbi:MAG: DUF1214 domain-containing protein [Alphaproteobacteria bacterium]
MRRVIIDAMLVIAIALSSGLGSALFALELSRNRGTMSIGPWTAAPEAGVDNPYAATIAATTLDLPFGASEGIVFTARTDSRGEPLKSSCSYTIAGRAPESRLWTLTVYDADNGLMANPASRTGFHSRELLWDSDGQFTITMSTSARPGNWIPTNATDRLVVVFRLYDTPLTTGLADELEMPDIRVEACR